MPSQTPSPPKKGKSKDQSKDQSSSRAKSSRAAKKTTFPAQTLGEMKCVRARVVAASLKIHDYARLSWPSELAPQIKLAMRMNKACVICGGGQCDPETHRFPATNPYLEVDELGNPIVDEGSDEDEVGAHKSPNPNTSSSSPSRHTLDALTGAAQPQDRVVALSEQAPGFIETLQHQPASGSGLPAPLPAVTPSSNGPPGEDSSGESSVLADSDPPSDDLDEELDQDAEFQKEIEELLQQQQTEKNTAINAKDKKKSAKLSQKKARKEAEARKAETRKQQLQEKRKRILAGMIAKHQEEMAAVEAADESSDEEADEVFAKPSDKNSSRSPRAPSRKSKKRVNIDDNTRSHSVRPPSDSDPAAGLTMASVLKMMDRQHKNTLKVVETALSSQKPSRVPVADLDGFGHETPSCGHEQSGRAQVILPDNPAAARELGLNPPINLAFQGKMENIDISKIRKSMTSGKNRSAQGLVLKQVFWPHDCISKASRHILGYSVKIKHENQTFAMFNEGMSQMMLLDTPQDKMDPILRNRLRFQSFIIRQSYVLGWKECLSIVEDFFEACEHANMSWENWPEIEKFLKESAEQIRLSASFRGRANSAPPGAGNPNGGGQQGKRFSDNANGVPSKWMVENKICVAYNLGYCPNQNGGDHVVKNITLRHWCGGCYKKSNGATKHAHSASTCGQGPFANLFV